MKKLVIPPAGPPGPIPSDVSATEPPKQQPEHGLSMNPNDLPLPTSNAEASTDTEEDEGEGLPREQRRNRP